MPLRYKGVERQCKNNFEYKKLQVIKDKFTASIT
jgi:hypothetical protein